jgi:hypothetical protein
MSTCSGEDEHPGDEVDVTLLVGETFAVTGRRTVALFGGTTELGVGRPHPVLVETPDGKVHKCMAWKERLLRRRPVLDEHEGFLLAGLSKSDVPVGSTVTFLGDEPTDTRG